MSQLIAGFFLGRRGLFYIFAFNVALAILLTPQVNHNYGAEFIDQIVFLFAAFCFLLFFQTQYKKYQHELNQTHQNLVEEIQAKDLAQKEVNQLSHSLEEAQKIGKIGSAHWNLSLNQAVWSPELYNLLGLNPADNPPIWTNFIKSIPKNEEIKEIKTLLIQLLQGKIENYRLEHDILHPGGKRITVEHRARRVGTGGKTTLHFTLQDITGKKKEAKMLSQALEQAQEANRMKSQFLANMSHEIRTPMNSILGFSEVLKEMEEDEEKTQFIDFIYNSGKNLLSLINGILDLSKVEAGKMELNLQPVFIQDIILELESIFTLKIQKKGLEFESRLDNAIPPIIWLDPNLLRQVLVNIVGNAVKFSDRGIILIEVQTLNQSDDGKLDLKITVQDQGIGISPEYINQIFDKFSRQQHTDPNKFEGTGLGLSISKGLIDLMGGEIQITSEVGGGSRIEISLPKLAWQTQSPKSPKVKENNNFNNKDKAEILVVDDINLNRQLIMAFLRQGNFKITEAKNGEEAVKLAKETNPDLILMDMKMPVKDGYQASREIREIEKLKSTPIIALTASAMDHERKNILEICTDYLSKPIKKDQLLKMLEHHLGV